MRDNTIFDDVFRTMMEKMTFLVVPLINDVFHTSYPADMEIVTFGGAVVPEHIRSENFVVDY